MSTSPLGHYTTPTSSSSTTSSSTSSSSTTSSSTTSSSTAVRKRERPSESQGAHPIPLKRLNAIFATTAEEFLRLAGLELTSNTPIYDNIQTNNPPPVANLIEIYDQQWSSEAKKFLNLPFNKAHFNELTRTFISQFIIRMDSRIHYGHILKRDVEPGTKIFVRGDLHGDLKSLLENLKTLRTEGHLDPEYRCNKNVHLVFLGDYADRGSHSMEVLQILLSLKLENRRQVTLIRGNHEDITLNRRYMYKDKNFKNYLQSVDNRHHLRYIYETMPITLYMSEITSGERQYVQFTHGALELYVDPQKMLASTNHQAILNVRKCCSFSERVSRLKQINALQLNTEIPPKTNPLLRRKRKQQIAAAKIHSLCENDFPSNIRPSVYCWGDLTTEDESQLGPIQDRDWKISAPDLKHSLRLSSLHHPIKMLFRGHAHKMHYYTDSKNKLVVTTMPVGMESTTYKRSFPDQLDRAYILTTGEKVKSWSKQAILRASETSTNTLTDIHPIHSLGV